MASAIPVLGPNSVIKPWIDQISQTLQTQLAVTIDTPPISIFEVPKPLKAENIEAYVPQRIGLGPNHHFRPELYKKMEQKKLIAVKRILKPHQIHDIENVVKRIKDIVPAMRACYESYIDDDDDTLAWVFAIDGLFLLDQLESYSDHQISIPAKDFIMLENQIPLIVLKEIQSVLWGEKDHGQEEFLESKFKFFCDSHSPFHLCKEKIDFSRVHHQLDYMYQFIVQNDTSIQGKVSFRHPENEIHEAEIEAKLEILEAVIKIARLIPMAQPFLQIVEFVTEKFPGKTNEKQMAEEIKVPTVSQLRNIAGVKFQLPPRDGGIRNIKFDVIGKERSVYLPRLYLNIDSEIILRNLVAYEQLMAVNSFNGGYSLELTEYVDFMCGIIDTSKDVKLLRDEKIIVGDIQDDEIVRLFNGISRSSGKMSGHESELRKTVKQLNKVYESTPVGWVQRLAEKQLLNSAKFLTFVVTVLSIAITVREVYSRAYGSNPPHMVLFVFLESKWRRLLR